MFPVIRMSYKYLLGNIKRSGNRAVCPITYAVYHAFASAYIKNVYVIYEQRNCKFKDPFWGTKLD